MQVLLLLFLCFAASRSHLIIELGPGQIECFEFDGKEGEIYQIDFHVMKGGSLEIDLRVSVKSRCNLCWKIMLLRQTDTFPTHFVCLISTFRSKILIAEFYSVVFNLKQICKNFNPRRTECIEYVGATRFLDMNRKESNLISLLKRKDKEQWVKFFSNF